MCTFLYNLECLFIKKMKYLLKYVGNIILMLAIALVVIGSILFEFIIVRIVPESASFPIKLFVLILYILFSTVLLLILDSLLRKKSKGDTKDKEN